MTRRFRAPGRVNLIGSHVDVHEGLVLPMALHLTTEVAGEAGGDRVRLTSAGAGEVGVGDVISPAGGGGSAVDVPADGSAGPRGAEDGWGRYVAGVVWALAGLGRPPVGFTGSVTSTVPAGAGLSSSAALTVAVASALCAVGDLHLGPLELADACRRAEVEGAGVPVGLMDPAVSALGSPTGALLLDCRTLEHRVVPLPDTHRVVVVDSGARRRVGDGRYAARRADVERGLALLRERHAGLRTLRDAGPAMVDELVGSDPVAHRRCRHVVTEITRVRQVVVALERGDGDTAGALLTESHRSDVEDYEASHPDVDEVVTRLASLPGVAGARMTGGGFGGVVVALVAAGHAEDVVSQVGPQRAFVAHPSPAAAEVT